jgi:tight adherence protein B
MSIKRAFSAILVGGLITWFIGNKSMISAGIGAIAGAVGPGMYVKSQQKKRLQKFNDQLSDMLNLMVNGLRAGYSTMQALEAISKELPAPICDEFRRVIQEMQIGIPMETALDNLLRRIPSEDLDFVVTAINVQREVGGNLSEILDNISFTIRERVRIKGGACAYISGVVHLEACFHDPIFSRLFYGFNPECDVCYAGGSDITGHYLCCSRLDFSSYFIMMKIADIEV